MDKRRTKRSTHFNCSEIRTRAAPHSAVDCNSELQWRPATAAAARASSAQNKIRAQINFPRTINVYYPIFSAMEMQYLRIHYTNSIVLWSKIHSDKKSATACARFSFYTSILCDCWRLAVGRSLATMCFSPWFRFTLLPFLARNQTICKHFLVFNIYLIACIVRVAAPQHTFHAHWKGIELSMFFPWNSLSVCVFECVMEVG